MFIVLAFSTNCRDNLLEIPRWLSPMKWDMVTWDQGRRSSGTRPCNWSKRFMYWSTRRVSARKTWSTNKLCKVWKQRNQCIKKKMSGGSRSKSCRYSKTKKCETFTNCSPSSKVVREWLEWLKFKASKTTSFTRWSCVSALQKSGRGSWMLLLCSTICKMCPAWFRSRRSLSRFKNRLRVLMKVMNRARLKSMSSSNTCNTLYKGCLIHNS